MDDRKRTAVTTVAVNKVQPSAKRVKLEITTDDSDSGDSAGQKAVINESVDDTTTSSVRKQRKIKATHSKQWRHVQKRVKKWIQKTGPYSPSVAVLYWKEERGRHQIVWEGSNEMEAFATSEDVIQAFRQAALSRPINFSAEASKTPPLEPRHPLQLHSNDPEDFRSDDLSIILPKILNPHGNRYFYDNEESKPSWFPSDVRFRRPNGPKKGDTRMHAAEMRKVLQAFFHNCPTHYTIGLADSSGDSTDEEHPRLQPVTDTCQQATHQPSESHTSEQLSHLTVNEPVHITENPSPHPTTGPAIAAKMALSTEEALKLIGTEETWSGLQQKMVAVKQQCDVEAVLKSQRSQVYKISEIARSKWDKGRKKSLSRVIPKGYYPGHVSKDGDCLYYSVSMAIFGDELHAQDLRLAATYHAVEHFDHYLHMYKQVITDVGEAVQFMSMVVRSDAVFDGRPTDKPSVEELLVYTLQAEVLSTARLGQYSGLLQVQFLAGAIQCPIRQHVQLYEACNQYPTVYPCGCTAAVVSEEVNVMWVTMGGDSKIMNHIIPLLPCSNVDVLSQPDEDETSANLLISYTHCLMGRSGQCVIATSQDEQGVEWVQCDRCGGWYHCICIGLSRDYFGTGKPFVCMCAQSTSELVPNETDIVLRDKGWSGKTIELFMSDIRSLYPQQGLTDNVIDFYTQCMLPLSSGKYIVRALGYTSFAEELMKCAKYSSEEDRNKILLRRFRGACGRVQLEKKLMIIFPCKIVTCWHWIALIAVPQEQKAFILDSASPTQLLPYSIRATEHVQTFLRLYFPDLILQPSAYKVPGQAGVECGVHTLHNIAVVARNPVSHLLEGKIPFKHFEVATFQMRGKILSQCCLSSTLFQRTVKLRRSTRICTSDIRAEKVEELAMKIMSKNEEGLKVVEIETKGRGIVATRTFLLGGFLCEYAGDVISHSEAKEREKTYTCSAGCYMYYFKYKGEALCVDATKESGRLGRLINHSKLAPNVTTKLLEVDGCPHLYLVAKKIIQQGEELLYDYGERQKMAIQSFPWLST